MLWSKATNWSPYQIREVEELYWNRAQGWKTTTKRQSRRVSPSTPRRNMDYCWRNIGYQIVQIQEDLPSRGSKRSTYWLSTKSTKDGWTNHNLHWWRRKETTPSLWQCNYHHFDDCKLHYMKTTSRLQELTRYPLLLSLLIDEDW